MTAPRGRSNQPASEPDRFGTPHGGQHNQAGHDFTLQAVMDLKGSTGELKAAVQQMQATLERIDERMDRAATKLDERFDKLEGKVSNMSTKLYAAWVVMGIFAVVGGWVIKETWDIAKPVIVQKLSGPTPAAGATTSPGIKP